MISYEFWAGIFFQGASGWLNLTTEKLLLLQPHPQRIFLR